MSVYAENRKAHFNYEILESFQAGLALNGQEVKSIKSGRVDLAGSYVVFHEDELFLIGAHIPPYQPANAPQDYTPERPRKLLVRKDELQYLSGKVKEKGLTLVPLRVYNQKRLVKLEFGLVRGKRKSDKRETLKKQETNRDIERALKGGQTER